MEGVTKLKFAILRSGATIYDGGKSERSVRRVKKVVRKECYWLDLVSVLQLSPQIQVL